MPTSQTPLWGDTLQERCRKSQEGKKSHPQRKVGVNAKLGTGPQLPMPLLMSVAVWFSFLLLLTFVLKQSRPIFKFRTIPTF